MVDALVRVAARIPYLNLALFFATVLTTLWAGAQAVDIPPASGSSLASVGAEALSVVIAGLPFAASLIAILLCHEMGHYLLARAYGVEATLPFFIPVPAGPVGTLGAIIRIRSRMPNRRAVVDIGAAGPLAGFAVALPLLAWGLAHSKVRQVGDAFGPSPLGMSAVAWLNARIKTGAFPDAGRRQIYGESLITLAVRRLVLGPLPSGSEVVAHPVALAAWFGLFVTALNLFPVGQLDGGHVTYALFGRRGARLFSRCVSWGLLFCGLFLAFSWLLWWAVARFVVRVDHPPAADETPLGPGRKVLALVALLLFAATFIPVPVSL